ncbi:hypothetical protein MKX03_031867 [Papaver bracteatum]|nr:hypothetical protein MKX03_031867 [Papaver bracteatum]
MHLWPSTKIRESFTVDNLWKIRKVNSDKKNKESTLKKKLLANEVKGQEEEEGGPLSLESLFGTNLFLDSQDIQDLVYENMMNLKPWLF